MAGVLENASPDGSCVENGWKASNSNIPAMSGLAGHNDNAVNRKLQGTLIPDPMDLSHDRSDHLLFLLCFR